MLGGKTSVKKTISLGPIDPERIMPTKGLIKKH